MKTPILARLFALICSFGTGMTDEVKDKIFQPFFTRIGGPPMPLSLAYDIVTKGHGGTIEVESVEGEGTTFTIKLPL
jgi:two-component system, NtrC family, sensor kinase